jgi:hypothetical protein
MDAGGGAGSCGGGGMSKALDQIEDYPLATPEGVDPVIYKAQMLQAMANRYERSVPGLNHEDGYAAAVATWETEWPDDPSPRTMAAALEAVDEDLTEWVE